jgi:hypothetical protein
MSAQPDKPFSYSIACRHPVRRTSLPPLFEIVGLRFTRKTVTYRTSRQKFDYKEEFGKSSG